MIMQTNSIFCSYEDLMREVLWIRKAAECGDAEAQFELGVRYRYGLGVSQSDTNMCKWYRKAAEQGFAEAQYFLGEMYEAGRGVPHDDKQVAFWYCKAAKQGHVAAGQAFTVVVQSVLDGSDDIPLFLRSQDNFGDLVWGAVPVLSNTLGKQDI